MIVKVDSKNYNNAMILASKLWPKYSVEHLSKELANETIYLYKSENKYIGYLQLSIRNDYVAGCKTNNVAYLEGIYVEPDFQRKGIGKEMVDYAVKWAKQNGCTEFASDCYVSNENSIDFHESVGFTEHSRVVNFVKII